MKLKFFLAIIGLMLVQRMAADDFYSNEIRYITSGNEAMVVDPRYGGRTANLYKITDVVIPATVSNDGITYTVTSIRDKTFQSTNVATVSLSDSLRSIGAEAFALCTNLRTITIPDGVTHIGGGAFSRCSSLTTAVVGNGVTEIVGFAFCNNLTSVTLGNNVKSIGNNAFVGCSGLTTAPLPSTVTSIGNSAFYDCSGLKSVVIPEGVTNIGNFAFNGCSGLTSVTIPTNVTTIGGRAFDMCKKLKSVTNYASTPQPITEGTFAVYGTLHVIKGCKTAYASQDYWKNFTIEEDLEPSLTLSNTSETLYTGQTLQLSAKSTPSDIGAMWVSSNEAVATVSSTGAVIAKAAGTAVITVISTKYPSLKATCTITVKSGSIFIDKASATLYTNQTTQISATKNPSEMIVIWYSSDENVATVSNDGNVTANSEGSALITVASAIDPSIKASCEVTVKNKSILLDKSSAVLMNSQTLQLTVTKDPIDMSVIWSSSNESVAIVSSSGLVTAKDKGTAIITAENPADPSLKATCTITVEQASISLDKASASLYAGNTLQLSATTNLSDLAIIWSSSDENVAVVNDEGHVTAKTAGTAVITAASAMDASVKAICSITVINCTISLNETSASLYTSQSFHLFATTAPSEMSIIWSSSNDAVATVSNDGLVTAKDAGIAIISVASATDASVIATCTISVEKCSILLDMKSATLNIGETTQLTASTTPSNMAVAWSSSNAEIATVSSTGLVTANKKGLAVIIVQLTTDGSVMATCPIEVLDGTEGIVNWKSGKQSLSSFINLNGQYITNAQRGINLQKMPDDTTKKVLMR